KAVAGLRDVRARLEEARAEPRSNEKLSAAAKRAADDFEAGMDDDLNTSVALAAVHDLTREVNTALARGDVREEDKGAVLGAIDRIDSVLNVFGESEPQILDDEIQKLIDARQEARHRRE